MLIYIIVGSVREVELQLKLQIGYNKQSLNSH
jgi:hypothetical protein